MLNSLPLKEVALNDASWMTIFSGRALPRRVLVLLVLGLDAGAATEEVLQTAGLQTDHVEVLVGVQSGLVALEVGGVLHACAIDKGV